MAYSGLDTRWWNLAGAAVVASATACGPSIVLDDDDGIADGDDAEDVDPDDGIDPDDGPPPPPPQCVDASDCGAGFECIDGQCIDYGEDDYYCQDGGCYCGDYGGEYGGGYGGDCCYDDCCYDGCYYEECYDHQECGVGGLCETGIDLQECTDLDLMPACDEAEVPEMAPLPLPGEDATEVISLSFVDANGDEAEDLIVGRTGEATLLVGPGDGAPAPLDLPLGSALRDAVSGDFNGDGNQDLAAAVLPSGVAMLLGDGLGGFALSEAGVLPLPSVASIAAIDFDGDGALDLATAGDLSVTVLRGDGAGGFAESIVLTGDPAGRVVRSTPSEAPSSLLVPVADSVVEWYGGPESSGEPANSYFGGQQLDPWQVLSAGAGAQRTLLGVGSVFGLWSVLDVRTDNSEARYWLGDDRVVSSGAVGDLTGDGAEDFALLHGDTVRLIGVQPSGVVCQAPLSVDGAAVDVLAAGDLDGDGRAELVTADGSVVTLHVSQ